MHEDAGGDGGKWVRTLAWTAIIGCVAWLLITGVPAAVLSWKSNTVAGWHWTAKALFALISFNAGLTYLVAHVLFKMDLLAVVRAMSPAPNGALVAPMFPDVPNDANAPMNAPRRNANGNANGNGNANAPRRNAP